MKIHIFNSIKNILLQKSSIKERIPLRERALNQRNEITINEIEVDDVISSNCFFLHNNLYHIHNKDNSTIANKLIPHFGSIFNESSIGIWLENISDNCWSIFLRIYLNKCITIDNFNKKDFNFTLNIFLTPNILNLSYLESNPKGYGGKGAIALYNFAQDINIKKITFYTGESRFCNHLGYGKPKENTNKRLWELEVKPLNTLL